jgi:SAM-dependent methyltransferase
MVVNASRARRLAPAGDGRPPDAVLWHEVECGGYRADLPLWRELAEQARVARGPARVLEIGAGTGRVTLDLARAGHRVTALDLDPELLGGLRARAAGLELETVRGDARTFALGGEDEFALCIVPMQTVQLLGGAGERRAFLRRAREHMRPAGVVACAIVGPLEPFDCDLGDAGPPPDIARLAGELYVSRVIRVQTTKASIVIERERTIHSHRGEPRPRASSREAVELARVSPRQLQREGIDAGLTPLRNRSVPATPEHVGSAVVVLRA